VSGCMRCLEGIGTSASSVHRVFDASRVPIVRPRRVISSGLFAGKTTRVMTRHGLRSFCGIGSNGGLEGGVGKGF
jgi:hypothetical protein